MWKKHEHKINCDHTTGHYHGCQQGRIQDLIRGGAPGRDRPKTAILGPQFCRILVLGPHFWWSGGGPGPPGPPPWIRPCVSDGHLRGHKIPHN